MPPNVQCLKCTTFDAAHKAAYEQCDIIHRDVSVGNILIVENRDEHPFAGFLHDFDYSSMSDAGSQQDIEMQEGEQAASPYQTGMSVSSLEFNVAAGEGETNKPKEWMVSLPGHPLASHLTSDPGYLLLHGH